MLDALRQCVESALKGAQNPAVLFSGGKDSLLLAALVREQRQNFTLVWFRTGEPDEFTRRIIKLWQPLTVLSWGPRDYYMLAEGGERALVHEFDFNSTPFPVVTDLAPGTRCSRLVPPLTPQLYHGLDVLLWGAKDCDTHWLKGNTPFPPDGAPLGTARLYAPLRHLSDEEVLAALTALGVPYTPQPDALPMCSACLETTGEVYCPELKRTIPAERPDWVPAITAFRTRFMEG